MDAQTVAALAGVGGLLMAVSAVFGAISALFVNRKKPASDEAAAAQSISQSTVNLLVPLNQRISDLEKQNIALLTRISIQEGKIADLEKHSTDQDNTIEQLRGGISVLISQLARAGIKPLFTLPE